MKKIISIVMLMICILNMILPVSVVYAEENTEYECIQLPIISDKSKKAVTDITLYKDDNTLYAPLHTVCDLINAEWHMKDGGFYISRDNCMYFRYYHDGNMKLIIDLNSGDDKWNKSDNVLLEGNLFSCKKIGEEWCVDFIKFCDMFGVTFCQVSPSTIQSAKDNIKKNIEDSAFEKLNSIDIENDLDFNNNPYYIYLYTGTPLISLYAQVMRDKNLYIWDYSCYENINLSEEDNTWIEKILKSIQYSDITQYLTIQSQNCLSNVVNDNWSIAKLITAPTYDSSEHYKKALVNISGINYGESLKLEDIENINKNNKAQELEQLLNSNTILSSSDSTITILNKYLNDQIKIPELEAFTKVSDVINWIGTPFQTYFEIENFHNKLNNINEDKIQLLTKSIIENDSINNVAEKQKIGNDILSYINKTASTNIFLNSIDNYTGLIDSSKEICSLYKNSDEQFKEKLSQSIESEFYALGDSAISKILEKSGNPYLILTGAVIGVYDGFTAWTKENFGEQLQSSEILVQAFFIERTMKESLDIKNPENLYNRLTLMLQASLCCFEYDENCFQTNRNKISKMLYILDNDKSINLNYYRDPRNNNVDENVKNAIKNYSDTSVVPIEDETNSTEMVEIEEIENYEWYLEPKIKADNIIVPDYDNELYEKYAIIEKNGKYGLISNKGEFIEDIKYNYFLICPFNIYVLGNGDVSDFELDDKKNNIGYKIEGDKLVKISHPGHGIGDFTYYYYNINDNKVYKVPQIGDNCEEYKSDNVVLARCVSMSIKKDGTYSCSNIYDEFFLTNNNGKINNTAYDDGINFSLIQYHKIIYAKKDNKYFYFNNKGEQIISDDIKQSYMSPADITNFSDIKNGQSPFLDVDNVIAVNTKDGGCFYDINGDKLTDIKDFEEVRPMINGFAWVKKDGKWGVIKIKYDNQIEELNSWQNLYSQYLQNGEYKQLGTGFVDGGTGEVHTLTDEDAKFQLAYIDNDDIPELIISGGYSVHIFTVKNNELIQLKKNDNNGNFSWYGYLGYREKEGLFLDSYQRMGAYRTPVYKLQNGECLLQANIEYYESVESGEIINQSFIINDKEVSLDDYVNELKKWKLNTYFTEQHPEYNIENDNWKSLHYSDGYEITESNIDIIISDINNIKSENIKQNKGTVSIEDGYLNVRESPSAKGKIIGKLYNSDEIIIEEMSEDNKWLKVFKGDIKGYVSKEYIKIKE